MNTHSQIYAAVEVTTKLGPGCSVGYLTQSNVDIKAGYVIPFRRTDVSTVFYTTLGYKINIGDEADNYAVTPSIGIGNYRIKNFDDWDWNGTINSINNIKPYLGFELSKDKNLGRFYLSVNYCGGLYTGLGIRMFFK